MAMVVSSEDELAKLILRIEPENGTGFLDEVVEELAMREAMTTNNDGELAQVGYIVMRLGVEQANKLLKKMLRQGSSRE